MDGIGGSLQDHVAVYTVVYLMRGSEVLLLRRRPDDTILPNCFVGVGGHLEPGEDPFIGAARECREESGLTPLDLRLRGTLAWVGGVRSGLLYVFTATMSEGTFLEVSNEGTLHWISIASLDTLEEFAEPHRRCIPRLLRDPTVHFAEIEQRDHEGALSVINSDAYFAERARR